MDTPRYIVLLSGGLDSVVNLHCAKLEGEVVKALTFDYGQRARLQEIKASRYFCNKLNIPHEVIDLPFLKNLTQTSLVNTDATVPQLNNLDDMTEARGTARLVWVPNRNGLFINIAACFAESLDAEFVIPGFNKEEAATFPDNSPAFITAASSVLSLSTLSQVKVACFTTGFDKTEMMKKAKELGVELKHVWSCYLAAEKPCGQCESCQRSDRAFKAVYL